MIELHSTGRRYAVADQEKELPLAFHHVVQQVVAKRGEWHADAMPTLNDATDLARMLLASPV